MDKMWKLFFISTFMSLSVLFLLEVVDDNFEHIEIHQNEDLDMKEVNQKMLLIEEKFNDLITKIIRQRKALKELNNDAKKLNKV